MVDEVWPTNSQQPRKRTSSITSLSNSTPGSKTLVQMQQQQKTELELESANILYDKVAVMQRNNMNNKL